VDEALRDLLSALLLAPNDPALVAEVQRLKRVRRDELRAVDSLFKDKLQASMAAPGGSSSGSGAEQAPPAGRAAWSSLRDHPSAGERAFNWVADRLLEIAQALVARVRAWLGQRAPAADKKTL